MEQRKCLYRVLLGNPEGKNHLEDPDVVGKEILKRIFRKRNGGHWIGLAEDRDRLRALVNAVMTFRIP
jgi:hypothetical protein